MKRTEHPTNPDVLIEVAIRLTAHLLSYRQHFAARQAQTASGNNAKRPSGIFFHSSGAFPHSGAAESRKLTLSEETNGNPYSGRDRG
jgi:hypothetical protein